MIAHAIQSCYSLIVKINFIKNEVRDTNRGNWRHQLKYYSPILDLCFVHVKLTYSNEIRFFFHTKKNNSSAIWIICLFCDQWDFAFVKLGLGGERSRAGFLEISLFWAFNSVSYASVNIWNCFIPSNIYYIL